MVKGAGGNPDAIGAAVTVTAGGVEQTKLVNPTRGYLTQVELPLSFGLGDAEEIDSVRVVWPDGSERTLTDVIADNAVVVARP